MENERLANEFIIERLAELGDEYNEARAKIQALPLPYKDADQLLFQRKWLTLTGGQIYRCLVDGPCSLNSVYISGIISALKSPEYGLVDMLTFFPCLHTALEIMWPELMNFDAAKQIPVIKVPLVVVHGAHDKNTPHALVQPYVDKVVAPDKEVIWIEEGSHICHKEKPEQFQSIVIATARKYGVLAKQK